MYAEYYGLSERPFELNPDLRYLYLSPKHDEALAHLLYGVEERRGFVQLTGDVGTGKTTMLDVLLSKLDASTKVATLSNTTIGRADLLRGLAWGLGIESRGRTKLSVLRELSSFLTAWTATGRNAVFVIDEAQNFSPSLLEEVRLLSNMRSSGRASIQIVLAGQPELSRRLELRELRQLRQRIGIRYHLTPLSRAETAEYVNHRLRVAGANGRSVFSPDGLESVFGHSGGVPRVVNVICDNALLAGYAHERPQIDGAMVSEAVSAIENRRDALAEPSSETGCEQSWPEA